MLLRTSLAAFMAALHGLRSEVGNQPDKTAGYQSGFEFDAIMSLLEEKCAGRTSAEQSGERTDGCVVPRPELAYSFTTCVSQSHD